MPAKSRPVEPAHQNIRGLVQDLSEILDTRSNELRVGTRFEDARPSDAKAFMLISRQRRSLSNLARALGISRQAAHSSVQRLVKAGVVAIEPAPGSARDKIPVITEKGQDARVIAARNIIVIETELGEKIGKKRLELLRGILIDLLE